VEVLQITFGRLGYLSGFVIVVSRRAVIWILIVGAAA